MIDPFERYPPGPGVHPERPMWKYGTATGSWTRTDGVVLARIRALGVGWKVTLTDGTEFVLRPTFPHTVVPEGREVEYVDGDDDTAALFHVDRLHPTLPPPPRCRQVWVTVEGDTLISFEVVWVAEDEKGFTILVNGPVVEDGSVGPCTVSAWPPPGCVMVCDWDGPAVWYPEGWVRPEPEPEPVEAP